MFIELDGTVMYSVLLFLSSLSEVSYYLIYRLLFLLVFIELFELLPYLRFFPPLFSFEVFWCVCVGG